MRRDFALHASRTTFPADEQVTWAFEVLGPEGHPSRYRVQHERELHLIVVRHDLSTFAHLHPKRRDDGVWEIDLTLPKAGSYAAFADIAPDDEDPMTVRLDLVAEGHTVEDEIFAPSRVTSSGDYRVELVGDVIAGSGSHIEFRVSRDEDAVEPDPYLGAAGHLVAIRAGDLDYLHVHPMESEGVGSIPFMMHASGPGLYRLFLQFLHGGEVRTADLTVQVSEAN